MDINVLRDALRTQPFLPFRLHLTDGRTFRVQHPELLALGVTGRTVVYVNPDENDRIVIVNTLLGVTLEFDSATQVGGGNGVSG
jgi:hypothetical protein